MTNEEAKEYIASLTNEDLIACFDEAVSECDRASKTEPESDWHQECFAAVMYYVFEISNRGLRKPVLH